MTSPNPIVGAPSPSGPAGGTSSAQNGPSNTLGPNSFITLLTAQLQAQDPLSPMDPDQMVNELTSINTLQQLVQIRSDMDTLVSAAQNGQNGGGAGSGNGSAGSGSGAGNGGTSGSGAAAATTGATNRSLRALGSLVS